MNEVRASAILDPDWMRERITLARALYGDAPDRVLGTVWWYSTSSVLVAPPIEALVHSGGPAVDPGLDAIVLRIQPDGRLLEAVSTRPFAGDLAELAVACRDALAPAIRSVADACGAGERALWAIAADSIASRFLWAGQATRDLPRARTLCTELAEHIGDPLPLPRFADYGGNAVVRRVSCCLIDQATGQQKCASCPNQHPDEREWRIRSALGLAR